MTTRKHTVARKASIITLNVDDGTHQCFATLRSVTNNARQKDALIVSTTVTSIGAYTVYASRAQQELRKAPKLHRNRNCTYRCLGNPIPLVEDLRFCLDC